MCSVDGFTGDPGFTIEQFGKFNEERGPDGTNYYKTPELSIAHSLLAISPNAQQIQQPMVDYRNGNVLAYNGEIYGLPDDVFDTQWLFDKLQSDGVSGLKYNVNGMWAFAFYEPLKQKLHLCRDHFGVKPMYYMVLDDQLFFSSTPKPLYATLNFKGIGVKEDRVGKIMFDENDRFLFGTQTPYRHIKKLAAGQILTWDLAHKKFIATDTMWGNDKTRFSLITNLNWDPEELKELMVRAVGEVGHQVGVKKAVSLSGGLDSTLIASINKNQDNIIACTTSFEERLNYYDTTNSLMYEESRMAAETAKILGMECFTKQLPLDYNTAIQETYYKLGVPMWDRARVVPRYWNVLNAKKQDAKIYMVGDLADELVTGYSGDYDYFRITKPWVSKELFNKFGEISKKYRDMQRYVPTHVLADDGINNKLFLRIMMHSDGFCTTVDHLAGSQGMESRVPFLHQELAKYLMTIPSAIKLFVPFEWKGEQRSIYKGIYKYVFREFMAEHLPDHVRLRKNKAGFAAPWNSRNRELNRSIGQEDMNLQKKQAQTFFKIGVDQEPVFQYNDESIVYNITDGVENDG